MTLLMSADEAEDAGLSPYVPLRYSMTMVTRSDTTQEPGNNIVTAIDNLGEASTVLIYGDAGTGKSTSLHHLKTQWLDQSGLAEKFEHLYLITIRDVASPTSSLEHIICNDLELFPAAKEQQVRRFIKFKSESIIWLLDGYDEQMSRGVREPTINKLISGEYAPKSTVVVTSRPNSAQLLLALLENTKRQVLEIHLTGFDDTGVKDYLAKLPHEWAPDCTHLANTIGLPRELLRLPLFLAMVSYLSKQHHERSMEGGGINQNLLNKKKIT